MINTFIFCHDQDIVLDLLNTNKYKDLTSYKIIFLGNRPVDKIETNENVIVSRNLPSNIEQYKNCLQYCGWYAVYKNNLISTSSIRLIDYDVDIDKWVEHSEYKVKGHLCNDLYFYFDDGFGEYFKFRQNILKKTGNTPRELATNFAEKYKIKTWFSAADVLIDTNIFNEFMGWVEGLFEQEKDCYYFGMHFERYLCIFCMYHNIEYECSGGETNHQQLMSHPYY